LTAGKIGSGTTTPYAKLDVRGSTIISQIHFASSDVDSGGYIGSTTAGAAHIAGGAMYIPAASCTAEDVPYLCCTGNNAGCGWTAKTTTGTIVALASSGVTFFLNGSLTADVGYTPTPIGGFSAVGMNAYITASQGTQTLCATSTGSVYTVGGCTASLRSLKENIVDSKYGLDTIMKLRPVEFDYKPEYGGEHHLGFIADDTPSELVIYDKEGNVKDLANDRDFISVLVKGMQEQQEQIEELKHEIDELKSSLKNTLKCEPPDCMMIDNTHGGVFYGN
jgi:hypothetical protein